MSNVKATAAGHVLGYWGVEGFPEPDVFHARLLDAINATKTSNDVENFSRIQKAFPEYTNANHIALHTVGGLSMLKESAANS